MIATFEYVTSKRRLCVAFASLATVVVLSGCGGGGSDRSSANFNLGVVVGGQFVSEPPVTAGGSLNVVVRAGQSLKVDAGEQVVWTLLVGGSAISGSGTTVYYAGADISVTMLNAYQVALDTNASYPLQAPVPITLIATSTFDSAQVVTVNVLITN